MATEERIEALKEYVAGWQEWAAEAVARRDKALHLKRLGVVARDAAGTDILQKQADDADEQALEAGKNVIRMQSILGRAQAGEDV